MTRSIILVEDEAALRVNYSNALERQGYDVRAYADMTTARQAFEQALPDLVILDIGLGQEQEGGFELCRLLRSRSETLPIIFLTARDSDLDTISGLRLGADDYLTKSITLEQLMARVAALFRRIEALSQRVDSNNHINKGKINN